MKKYKKKHIEENHFVKVLLFTLVLLLIVGCSQANNPVDTTENEIEDTAAVSDEGASEEEASATDIPEPTAEPTLEPTAEPTIELFRPEQQRITNLYYIEGGTAKQKLDLQLPVAETADQTFPIIMLFHQGHSSKSQMANLAGKLAGIGISSVSVEYKESPVPAPYEDGACALGWVYENAEEYGFDLEKLYMLGYSAGGTLVAFLATIDDYTPYTANCPDSFPEEVSFAGIITYTGIFDYTVIGENEGSILTDYVVEHLDVDYATGSDTWWEMSPTAHIDGNEPEFVLFHGESDRTITPSHSNDFAAALQEVGVEATVKLIIGVDHMGLIESIPAYNLLAEYLLESIQ